MKNYQFSSNIKFLYFINVFVYQLKNYYKMISFNQILLIRNYYAFEVLIQNMDRTEKVTVTVQYHLLLLCNITLCYCMVQSAIFCDTACFHGKSHYTQSKKYQNLSHYINIIITLDNFKSQRKTIIFTCPKPIPSVCLQQCILKITSLQVLITENMLLQTYPSCLCAYYVHIMCLISTS